MEERVICVPASCNSSSNLGSCTCNTTLLFCFFYRNTLIYFLGLLDSGCLAMPYLAIQTSLLLEKNRTLSSGFLE